MFSKVWSPTVKRLQINVIEGTLVAIVAAETKSFLVKHGPQKKHCTDCVKIVNLGILTHCADGCQYEATVGQFGF
ncbi:MAG: hypothetical protein CBC09_07455 [Cellvibrionales bacterium TMED49]|nr:hypothetical protein [Porticoccaceae bacterium]OUU37075.1 MAG: hypothetical protein CBC09_07455 [Cellvibrionales bacterium TMED49]